MRPLVRVALAAGLLAPIAAAAQWSQRADGGASPAGAAPAATAGSGCEYCQAMAADCRRRASAETSVGVQREAHAAAARAYLEAAGRYDAEYRKCVAGQPSQCGRASSPPGGLAPPGSAPPDPIVGGLVQGLRQLSALGEAASARAVEDVLRSVRELRIRYGGAEGAAAGQAMTRLLGRKDLDDVEPPAPAPAPPTDPAAPPASAEGPSERPLAALEPSPEGVQPGSPDLAPPESLVPIALAPATEEDLADGLAAQAAAAWKSLSSDAKDVLGDGAHAIARRVAPDATEAVEELAGYAKELERPAEDRSDHPVGDSIEEESRRIARAARDEDERKDVERVGKIAGGASDKYADSFDGEESHTGRAEFDDRLGAGGVEVFDVVPGSVRRLKEKLDEVEGKLRGAKELAEKVSDALSRAAGRLGQQVQRKLQPAYDAANELGRQLFGGRELFPPDLPEEPQ